MQSKLLSLLLFAAFAAFTIATDEAPTSEFPKGLFAIENVYFPYYANVKNDSPESGMPIVIDTEITKSGYWHYDSTTGNLVNSNSGSNVLTLPADGSRLTITAPEPKNPRQIWIYQDEYIINKENNMCANIDPEVSNGTDVGLSIWMCDGLLGQKFNLVPKKD